MMQTVLSSLMNGEKLSEKRAEAVMDQIMAGDVPDSQISSLLTVLRFRGETVDELTGFARSMRAHATSVARPELPLLDTCGTGGDQAKTFNISTASAIGLSACGVAVAKHGNRFVSSKSGSADVLEILQVQMLTEPKEVASNIERDHLAFLFAPLYHSAMKHVANTRKMLGFRTIFNILGPLTNPANADFQVVGVFDANHAQKMAEALQRLGAKRALFVTGEDGMDEVTITGKTFVTELNEDGITSYTVAPENFGLPRGNLQEVQVDSVEESARVIENIIAGSMTGSPKNILLMNMAAGLYVSGQAKTWNNGYQVAKEALESGKIASHLRRLQRKEGKVHA